MDRPLLDMEFKSDPLPCGIVTVKPPGSGNHVKCPNVATHLVRMVKHGAQLNFLRRIPVFEAFACDDCTADLRRLALSNSYDILAVSLTPSVTTPPPGSEC